jgi:hypothetical protein
VKYFSYCILLKLKVEFCSSSYSVLKYRSNAYESIKYFVLWKIWYWSFEMSESVIGPTHDRRESSVPTWQNTHFASLFTHTNRLNFFYVHVTVHRDMWPCIVTCDRASWHVTVHRDIHVTVHRDVWSCIVTFMWPCIVTCDRASWHVTVHRDMWSCIVTCDRASWHVTVYRDKSL